MLALGSLAGGIVHDFNNLLLVMTGHVELTRRLLGEGHPGAVGCCRRCTPPSVPPRSRAGCSRSAAPTAAAPPCADVGELVSGLEPLLRQQLGPYVRLEVRAGRGLAPVRVEPSQLEQLLLNLVLNARDAMPAGGRLTIETQDVEIAGGTAPQAPPGRYAMIAVSDEASAWTPRPAHASSSPSSRPRRPARDRASASPRSSRSWSGPAGVVVDSEPGLGTTFRVYLPCAAGDRRACDARARGRRPQGRETVLVAEGSAAGA